MLRLTALLRRNRSLTHDEFVAHWRGVHAPLMARPAIARHIVRYEQHAVAVGLPDWVGTPGVDGVAVQWFEDLDAFTAFLAEADYRDHIAPDEARLLDVAATQWLVTDEPVVVLDDHAPVAGAGSVAGAEPDDDVSTDGRTESSHG